MTPGMFSVNQHGWLEYAPFKSGVKLPAFDFESDAERAKASASAIFTLRWPGALREGSQRQDDSLPAALVEAWPAKTAATPVEGRYPLAALVAAGLPDELPEALAYHLAVNHRTYGVLRPVAGLPAELVQRVLVQGRFDLDADYRGAAKYLAHVCESNWRHPLLTDFDTEVRERFGQLSLEAARLYFYALSDRLVTADAEEDADEAEHLWPQLATYLFWVGRTGMGNYGAHAGLFAQETSGELAARLAAWNPFDAEGPFATARGMSRVG
jgi:hypothetical protein